MRLALRLLLAFVVVAGPLAGRASAVTIKELLDYKGRLSDDILIALIESDGSVFHLSISDVASLRDKGLSDRVIIAMLKTAHRNDPPPAPASTPTATPNVAQTEPPPDAFDAPPLDGPDQMYGMQEPAPEMPVSQPTAPVVVPVQPADQVVEYVPYPVYVPVPVAVRPHPPAAAPQPQYWGWGGQRRPDSWPLTPAPAPKSDVSSPQSVAASKTGPSPASRAAAAQAATASAPPAPPKATPAQTPASIPPNATTTKAAAGSGTSPLSKAGGG
jgi:hypothetical protein